MIENQRHHHRVNMWEINFLGVTLKDKLFLYPLNVNLIGQYQIMLIATCNLYLYALTN